MPTLQAVKTYKHPYLVTLGIALYAVCICLMAKNSGAVTSAGYMMYMGVAMVTASFLSMGGLCNCIFFTIPFTAVLKLPVEAFSFITLMQLILIIRFVVTYPKTFNTSILIVFWGIMTQIFPMLFFSQTMSNLILLLSNLLTFYCTYRLSKDSKLNINHAYLCFTIGVVLACLISFYYEISVVEHPDYRFCGLWTDPNFWSMFCLIGITTCLLNGFRKPLLFVVFVPIIITLAYFGFMTLSRTFIIVCSLIILVTSATYLKKTVLGSVAVVLIFIIAIYYALPYAEMVFTERALDENDITNGRFINTVMIYDFVKYNIEAIMFGLGYNNTLDVMNIFSFGHGATHNTYVDLLFEFGIITNLVLLVVLLKNYYIIKRLIKNLFSLSGIVFCILVFYMGTLSMGKYALLFLFAGAYIGSVFAPKHKEVC